MKLQLSIIIPSYNTKDLLKNCLDSINNNLKDIDYEVIVVDNASKDGTQAFVRQKYKDVILLENRENLGFAKAINIGGEKAKGKYLFFLNSDAIFTGGLVEAVSFLENNQKVGVAGGRLVNVDGSYQKSHGSFSLPGVLSLVLFGAERESTWSSLVEQQTDWVSGGCFLIRADLFKQLGGFDENLFMYVEDMELCFRIKKASFQVVYFPKLTGVHIGQGSASREFAIAHIYRGLLYFFKKHRNHVEYSVVWLLLAVKAVAGIIIGLISGNTYLTKTYSKALRNL